MNRKYFLSALVTGLMVFCATQANAALIAYYVDGTDADAAALVDLAGVPVVIAGNLANVGFEGGSSITRTEFSAPSTPAGPTAGSSPASEWLFSRANVTQTTPGTNTDYYGFTVTAAAGRELNLTDLTFDRTSRANTGGGIITTYEVFAAVDGGSFTSYGSGSITAPATLNTFLDPASTQVANLSSITGADSVEIRIALGDNSSANSKSSWVQGIQLQGDVVRKPATMLAYYVDGTDADAAALVDLAGAAGVTAGNLANVGFEGGTSITRTEFGSPSTPAGPTAGSSPASEWLFSRANVTQATPGTNTDYYGFTVTAGGGTLLDLTNLEFDTTNRANTAGGITTTYEVFASIDGGPFSSYGFSSITAPSTLSTFLDPAVTQFVDLSSITGAISVDIRLALGDTSGVGSKSSWVQGVQLWGNIVVPEPSTFVLAALGLLGLAFRGRRKRRI